MNGHPEFLELVAASIDFDLTDEEFGRLNHHLTRCPECRQAAAELRDGAAAIAALPAPRLAPARADKILRAALRTPPAHPRWSMLAVAAVLATLAGGVALAGLGLIDDDPAPSEPPPSQVAQVSPPPSSGVPGESADPGTEPSAEPAGTPDATPTPPPDTDPVDFEFPLTYTSDVESVRVAPLADGRVWVSFGDADGTVLALLDDTGAGEPLGIPGAVDCIPLAVPDGSVRLLCQYGEDVPEDCDIECYDERVFAYSARLDELPGFPTSLQVDQSGSLDRHGARVVGASVVIGFTESFDEGDDVTTTSRLITVGEDGSVTPGSPLDGLQFCCAIGPDGVAYGSAPSEEEGLEMRTELAAFDQNGLRPGWPVVVDGTASGPSFGPNGQILYSSWIDEASRIGRLNPDGSPAADPTDVGVMVEWDPVFDGPMPPLVDERSHASFMADGRIHSLDATGAPVPGFPYEPESSFVERGGCPPPDTGCQSWTEPPRIAPRGLVYTIEAGPNQDTGERITVVNPDGSVRSGWPKTLQRPGAMWNSVTIGENRIAYAVAIEPEPNNESSISILAFSPNGTREWIRTIVEP
jgi:hypothetical protein